jgi:glycosyltransferase involved in cell wall biosynthesis
VVVTHYERPRLLSTCLEALSAQTHQPIEVIVADDGSSSAEAVEELTTSEARSWPWSFRVLRLSHGGVHGARNAGWRAATGELVLFVDDDDVPFPELVETLLAARAESGADVVSASSRTFNGEGPPVARTQDVISLKLGEPYEMGVLSNHYGGPTCLWPRALLERLHGFADSFALAEDWEILARAAAMGVEIVGTPNPLFWNRQLQGGRVNRSLYALRDRSLTTVASHFSTELPETLSMLPLLAAGAYEELERRKARSLTRRFRVTRRSQELIRHARSVAVDEGWRSVLERAVSSLVRRWG